jgi:hypothetical protein
MMWVLRAFILEKIIQALIMIGGSEGALPGVVGRKTNLTFHFEK